MDQSFLEETWRPVPGLAPYEASSLGRVRRRRILNGCLDGDGYRRVNISLDGKARMVPIHTLVALAFVGPRPSPRHTVAHGDGVKTNNRAANLRWALMTEQYEDRRRHGTDVGGERHPRARLSRAQAEEIRTIFVPRSKTHGALALAARFGVGRGAINNIVHKGGWR